MKGRRLGVKRNLRRLVRSTEMVVVINDVQLTNLWKESFPDRNTGEQVEFFRAMLNKAGEAPMQLGVQKEDEPVLSQAIGVSGNAVVEIDARPGQRVRVYLKEFEA